MYILTTVMDHEHAEKNGFVKNGGNIRPFSNPMFLEQSFKLRLYFVFIFIKHLFTGILSRSVLLLCLVLIVMSLFLFGSCSSQAYT